ncbi:hypothetical protein [uncultured Phycicoccus sp.]|uniref:hypothetical protein n=1 Tax=uncultured Phycicoccus sp. TaxID=661422 RepID=UPI002629B8D4|nr:hypothetical protein [uncultured Phycicoccus sp.]
MPEHAGDAPGPSAVDAFGARWRLDVHGLGAPLDARMRELWRRAAPPHLGGEAEDVRDFVITRADDAVIIDGSPYRVHDDAVPYAVSRALTVASIGRRSGACLLLHAAGVAAPDGTTLALVAPSGTGKTTAARTLGRSFGYVSDETVAIEDDLTVRAYPKPLSVVVDPDSPHDKIESSPDELGLVRAPDRLRLGGVVVLERDPAVDAPTLTEIGLVEAAVEVIPQTSAWLRMAEPATALAGALCAGGGPWRLRYREIADCRALLEGLVRPPAVPPRMDWTWEPGPCLGDGTEARQASAGGDVTGWSTAGRVRRASYRFALHSEGATLAVVGMVPLGLPGLAATLWQAAAEPLGIKALTAAAVAVHGGHPRAAEVVDATVRSLLSSGAFELVTAG